jgi:molecular chaperone GrpE
MVIYNMWAMVKNEENTENENTENEVTEVASESNSDAVTSDDDDVVTVEQAAQNKVKKLKTQLNDAATEKQNLQEELQRTKADHLNARRRIENEKTAAIERAQVAFLADLLPLCDSFRMAKQNHAAWEQVDEQWRKGFEGIESQLNAVLEQYNVCVIGAIGETFNPQQHEALQEKTVDNPADVNTIREVVQPGYSATINETEHLIRPARVVVGTAQTEPEEEIDEEGEEELQAEK